MGEPVHEAVLRADGASGVIAGEAGGGSHHQATGPLGKAFSHFQHLMKVERRRWALFLGAGFGVMLTAGHVIGSIGGLMEGYERLASAWLPHEAREANLGSESDTALAKHVRSLAQELQTEFLRARDRLERDNVVDFSRAEEAVASLQRIDQGIGHIWYYQGEIKRLKSPTLFTPKSCMKSVPVGPDSTTDFYHNDFYRYLELADGLPAGAIDRGLGSTVCYEKSDGYCVQRIAWVHHLLANDFYQEAVGSSAVADRVHKLKRASAHAHEAHRYHDPDGVEGFAQCTSTAALEQRIDEQLRTLEK
jgi:hypothetical protein